MTYDPDLKTPESLQVPNIPYSQQSLTQLVEERRWWLNRIAGYTSWGGAITFAVECQEACEAAILRRFNVPSN